MNPTQRLAQLDSEKRKQMNELDRINGEIFRLNGLKEEIELRLYQTIGGIAILEEIIQTGGSTEAV